MVKIEKFGIQDTIFPPVISDPLAGADSLCRKFYQIRVQWRQSELEHCPRQGQCDVLCQQPLLSKVQWRKMGKIYLAQ